MCGRMVLTRSAAEIAYAFGIPDVETGFELVARYNVAPTQDVAAIRLDSAGDRQLSMLHWGLVPFWAREKVIGNRMINARAETAAEKPAFRTAMRRRRCIVPIDGFYEWQRPAKEPGAKRRPPGIPHYFRAVDRAILPIAGLWEQWTDRATGEVLESCTLLTTGANHDVRPIHHRMPVILARGDLDRWFDPTVEETGELKSLLAPAPLGLLDVVRVGTQVNNPRYDEPDCVDPVA